MITLGVSMNRRIRRQRTVAVVMASSLAVVSACSASGSAPAVSAPGNGTGGATAHPSVFPGATRPAPYTSQPSITNGTPDVVTGGRVVHFGSTVTDEVWSPDGSRLAYIDGDGNIATALPDGSEAVALTITNSGVKRAQPAWTNAGYDIVFAERGADGVWRLKAVGAVPQPGQAEADAGLDGEQTGHDSAPSGAYVRASGTNPGTSRYVFAHDTAGGSQVWILDYNQRTPYARFLLDGSAPALSPDGGSVAYVGKKGQIYITPVAKPNGPAVAITSDRKHVGHLAWSADGQRIAFSTATDVESISVKLAPGVTTNPIRVESPTPGAAAYMPRAKDTAVRFTGTDPIADSIALSRALWNPTGQTVNYNGESNPAMPGVVTLVATTDRSAAGIVADIGDGPILFTDAATLDPRVATEIKRALGHPAFPGLGLTVQLVGGPGVISDAVAHAAASLGYNVIRISDTPAPQDHLLSPVTVISDTDTTAMANIRQIRSNGSLLVMHGSSLTPAQQSALASTAPNDGVRRINAVGAEAYAALSAPWPGRDGLEIGKIPTGDPAVEALDLAARSHRTPSRVAIVAADDWRGALLAATEYGVVILVGPSGSISTPVVTWLHQNAPTIGNAAVFGSTSAVPEAILSGLATAISGPVGYTTGIS